AFLHAGPFDDTFKQTVVGAGYQAMRRMAGARGMARYAEGLGEALAPAFQAEVAKEDATVQGWIRLARAELQGQALPNNWEGAQRWPTHDIGERGPAEDHGIDPNQV